MYIYICIYICKFVAEREETLLCIKDGLLDDSEG